MTKDKIKKGLECCSNYNDCEKCPYHINFRCNDILCKDAHELITEQEKEIDRLKANINQSQDQILETAQKNQEYREQQVKQAKIDVLNELTVKAVSLSAIETYHICNLVDELIKEIEK